MSFKQTLQHLFMSKTQTIYLITILICDIFWGGLSATYAKLDIGLGTRFYSIITILACLSGVIYAFINTDVKKKRWVFKHYKLIDICETVFYTLLNVGFLAVYFIGNYSPIDNVERIYKLFFVYSLFNRIIETIVTSIFPSVGDIFEQSLYKNQLDYQNHSNAEMLMACFGAAFGAFLSFGIGDFVFNRPFLIFLMVLLDWLNMYGRWQFYFNKDNYKIIIENFNKDCEKYKEK